MSVSPYIDIEFYKDYVFYIDHPGHVEWLYQISHERARQRAARAAIIIRYRLFERIRPDVRGLIDKEVLTHILPENVPVENIGRKTVIRKYYTQITGLIGYIEEINLKYRRQFRIFRIPGIYNELKILRNEEEIFKLLLPVLRNFSENLFNLSNNERRISKGLLTTGYIKDLLKSDFGIDKSSTHYFSMLIDRQNRSPEERITFPLLPARNYLVSFGLLNTSVRLVNSLFRGGVTNLKDLILFSFPELLAISNLGAISISELGGLLNRLGTSIIDLYPDIIADDRKLIGDIPPCH